LSRVANPQLHRQRRSDGLQTHASILTAAVRLASVEGLSGLSVGRLAETVGVSKSGLYAHFGSKQQLQLDIIQAAREIFEQEVIEPALGVTEGRPRIEALCESYLTYIETWVFPGGCFFAGLLAEFDAQTGPPHQAITEDQRDWTDLLESQVVQAQTNGELDHAADPGQLAFELTAAIQLANYYYVLFRDPDVLQRARAAIRAAVAHASIPEGR
jgi:AcrR family transcriptional regulator